MKKKLLKSIASLAVTASIVFAMGANLFAATDFTPMTLGTSYNVTNVTREVGQYYSFTPSETNHYAFSSNKTSGDPYIYVYSDPGMQNQVAYNDDGGEAFNFYLTVSLTANTTYYIKACAYSSSGAEYSFNVALAPTCTITYDPNGGEGSPVTNTVVCGTEASSVANPFSRTGYTFLGWNTDATATYPRYRAEANLGIIYSDMTLYAIWEGTIAATVTGFTGEYDGSAHGATITVTDPSAGATVMFGTSDGTYDLTESPTYTAVGTYTVYYKITATGYTDMTDSVTITITEPAPAPQPDPAPAAPSSAPAGPTPEQIRAQLISNFVERLYIVALDRSYDVIGRDYWVDQLMNQGNSGSYVAKGFFHSQEFLARDLSDEEFVTVLYSVFFDRTPDAEGFANWTNALANGATRDQVIAGFAGSPEWAATCARFEVNI